MYIYTHIHILIYTSNPQHELYKFELVFRGTFPKHSSKNPLPKGPLISLFDSLFSLTRYLVHSLMESKVRRRWGQTGSWDNTQMQVREDYNVFLTMLRTELKWFPPPCFWSTCIRWGLKKRGPVASLALN